MRPPEHWHLRRRRSRRPWPAIAAVALLVVGALLVLRFWPGGGEVGPPATVSANCAVGTQCPQGGGPAHAGAVSPPRITGRAASVIEASCGAPLYGLNEHLRLAPASLTKIATALTAVERADLDDMVDVRVNSGLLHASTASTVMGLEPGMRLSLRDLLYGLLLVSGNDAAIAVADHIAGNATAYAAMMNVLAQTLGLRDTHFANPHGLDEAGHLSSAHDMALLGRALLAQPDLAAIVRTEHYQPRWDGPEVWNGNELLATHRGAVGVKIGYTEQAGQTIVAAAERGGRTVIVSVLSAWDRYADATALLDWAFANTQPACDEAATAP
jgi:D-alanyl-D-alanine carboxypeptidase (penicillin-binding protein 5/6)